MASLKEIRGRIGSVQSTLKITSAMRLIASAKLHSAQNAIGNMVPYERTIRGVFQNLVAANPAVLASLQAEDESQDTVPATERPWAVVFVTSNQNLCGSFNSNLLKAFFESGYKPESTVVYCAGKYGLKRLNKLGFKTVDCCDMSGKADYEKSAALAGKLNEDFRAGKIAGVKLLYSHFVSVISQKVQSTTFLPFNAVAAGSSPASGSSVAAGSSPASSSSVAAGSSPAAEWQGEDFLVEPTAAEMISMLLPQVQVLTFHTAMLDSAAAEHAARSQAMQVASDNAEELISELSLLYNKLRQQAVTNEILDLAGGRADN